MPRATRFYSPVALYRLGTVDSLLAKWKLPKLIQEEAGNPHRQITIKENEKTVQSLPLTKAPNTENTFAEVSLTFRGAADLASRDLQLSLTLRGG